MDWTPAPRRSSAMRREQNLALVGAVVSGAVIATGVLLLLVARVNPDAGARVRGALLDVVTPVWAVVRAPFDGVGRAIAWGGSYVAAVDRNRALTTELATARADLQKAAGDQLALAQLKKLMKVRQPGRTTLVTARIVAATSGSVVRTAMIAAGTRDGVGIGLPVIAAEGLIGRTIEAGNHSTRVLLLADPASRIPVVVQRTGQAGLAIGNNRPTLELRDRVGPETPLRAGDRLVTSGDGGVFPPGVPVGTIIAAGTEPPLIRPAATPMGTGFVNIEAAWLPLPAEPVVVSPNVPVPIEARQSQGAKPTASTGAQ
ncbi:rod shape-determining protein MreC [Polymorphobacter fuscus]|nr:rod shape-determining protein MreC [Polymorphobacter fuscus]NJC07025.1 rod shape-determining protein MreC [Polymorphobacter fuscus]